MASALRGNDPVFVFERWAPALRPSSAFPFVPKFHLETQKTARSSTSLPVSLPLLPPATPHDGYPSLHPPVLMWEENGSPAGAK